MPRRLTTEEFVKRANSFILSLYCCSCFCSQVVAVSFVCLPIGVMLFVKCLFIEHFAFLTAPVAVIVQIIKNLVVGSISNCHVISPFVAVTVWNRKFGNRFHHLRLRQFLRSDWDNELKFVHIDHLQSFHSFCDSIVKCLHYKVFHTSA